jgi:hypothetical protein
MNSKGHPCDHISLSLDPAVNQMDSVCTVSSIFLMIIMNSFYLDPDLSGGLFALDFPSTMVYPDFVLSNCLIPFLLSSIYHLNNKHSLEQNNKQTKQKQIR